ncbi:MAG: hypothetical protein CL565_03115 [Alphaproteobacteria bacterium]|nr:hypothetical protein [Alphaproteobacteria bacterium]|tara:strand:- start:96 stop:353 length:258 start_codon:yes stop_codon:yes gene_type:complete
MGLRNTFLNLLTDQKYKGFSLDDSTGNVSFQFFDKSWDRDVSKTVSPLTLINLSQDYGHVALAPGFYVPASEIANIVNDLALEQP